MTTALYRGTHRTQYDGSALAKQNCTPTSGANGARCATGGKIDLSGAQVRARVRIDEETSPSTKGWSLQDLDLAMTRVGVPFSIGAGGWLGVREARAQRKMIVLQGDSEEFPNGTCSGAFDGDHAVTVHPETIRDHELGVELWLLGDPICRAWRWESEQTLRRYATNFRQSIAWGFFTTPVPYLPPPPVVQRNGWVRVTGSWFIYTVRGTKTVGYDKTTRIQKTTKGWSANVGRIIETPWGGRDRVFAEVLAPSAYAGTWVDTLDEPQVRHFTTN